ncbi:tetratricopeptide repeat protein [Frischella perrara]|uniref:tetratricopeptide repeat protein n=1 Tax=Frischella perrara TaxID=1267021 RepID=UPI0023F16C85|nr:tetratricopeptide repeat protein [Frischella perrara]
MTELTIDQEIEQLKKITRQDGAHKYALAQYELALIYQLGKNKIEQAEYYYQLVEQNDNPRVYADAQLQLGQIYQFDKGYIEHAEHYYQLVEKNDNHQAYADAQLLVGQIYQYHKNNIEQAEHYYQLVEKNDNPQAYAVSQYQLGQIYQYHKNNIEQAEHYYQLVEKNDNPQAYAVSQYQLGQIYQYHKNNIEQAEHYYQLVEKNDDLKAYTRAQFNLGIIHSDDPQLASKYYLQACDSNEAWVASLANLELGNIAYFSKIDLDLQTAKYYYQKVTYASLLFEAYITAQVMLALLNSGHNHLFENIEEYNDQVIDPINKIRELTVDIQKQLLVDFKLDKTLSEQQQQFERSVAHYTKPGVLFNLLKNEPSDFRLNVVDFMNDPTENQLLSNWLGIKSDTNNDIKSFLASFSFNHNSLNQFRLYGNENNIVGSSVSIVFDQQFFGSDADRSINNDSINFLNQNLTTKLTANTDILNKVEKDTEIVKDNDTTPLHPLSLFRCVYFDPETNYISIAKRNLYSFYLEHKSCDPEVINSKWQKYLDLLDEENKISDIRKLLKEIRKQIKKLKNNKRIQVISNLDQLISLALMPISCLIKHAAFEDEDECRIIYITHIADEKIQAPHDYASANSLFINYAKIEEYIDKIYLGPQCQPYHRLWITNHVRKSNNNSIKVIQSEMPLR